MADYSSGSITFSGLGSGTDFNSIVDQLKQVESIQLNRLKNWKSDWNERYIAFGDIISTVRDAKSKLTELNSPTKFLKKNAKSTNESVMTAAATADAVDGSHTINVKQLASNAIWASTKTYSSKQANFNATGAPQDFTYTYKGKTHSVSIAQGTTLESFANIVNQDRNNPGVKVSIIQVAGGYTFQLQGTESGAAADLSVHPTPLGGMGSGSTVWSSNNPIADPAASISSLGNATVPQTYELTLADGTTKSFTLDGDLSKQALVDAVNAEMGDDTASFVKGRLQFKGVKKVSITSGSDPASASNGRASSTMKFANAHAQTDPIGTAGETYSFTITKTDGTQELIELDGSKSYKNLLEEVKAKGFDSATLTGSSSAGYTLTIPGVVDVSTTIDGSTPGEDNGWKWSQTGAATDTIQAGVVPRDLTYSFVLADGSSQTLSITNDMSMNDLVSAINTNFGADTASINAEGHLEMNGIYAASGYGLQGQVISSENWAIRRATDAVFTIDNWPQDMVSSTNAVNDVLEGVTLTLNEIGTAQMTVNADLDSVRENIQLFLDTINDVVKKVQDLTKVDSEKQVASSDKSNSNYSASQWDQEKGSLLTGNYGVQLFNTRLKQAVSSTGIGFTPITGGDLLSGDFVTALSQIGIKTDTEEGSPTYGLFCIAPLSGNPELQMLDNERFEDALTNHLDAVINIFAADDSGSTTSADFRYSGHIKGITKAGSYPVSYTVADDGSVTDVYINGVKAEQSDLYDNTYTVGNAGNATGMSVVIDNLTPGTHKGEVSIKQGKVRQLEDFFTAELVYHEPNLNDLSFSENNGALMILQANYKQIMDNAETKIQKEQNRIDQWETRQRQAFARLETLLGQYQQNQKSLESQLAQFSN